MEQYIKDLEFQEQETIKEPSTVNRQPTTDKYYIAIGDKQSGFLRFEPVTGKPLKLKSLEDYDVFAFQDDAGKWYCTYGLTGHLIPNDLFFYDPFNYPKPTKSDFGFQSIEDMQLFYDSLSPEYLAKLVNSLNSAVAMSYLSPRKEIRQKGSGGHINNKSIRINNIGKNYHRKTHGKKQQMLLDIHS